jgi:hypothetical protein
MKHLRNSNRGNRTEQEHFAQRKKCKGLEGPRHARCILHAGNAARTASSLRRDGFPEAVKTRTQFAQRIDMWDNAGQNIIEHLAGVEDFEIAGATYRAAIKRWPKAIITFRQGVRVIPDSRRTEPPPA